MTDRKKPGVAFWATVALSSVVLYVLGVGPAMSIGGADWCSDWGTDACWNLYSPLRWLWENGPPWIYDAIDWYCNLFP